MAVWGPHVRQNATDTRMGLEGLGCPRGLAHALPQIALDSVLGVAYARHAHYCGASLCQDLLARCSVGRNGNV
jgi:hypothetical protein